MAQIDLVCSECKHAFEVVTKGAIKGKQKRCPKCDSDSVRQTFASYLRNGPLSDPDCGSPRCTTYG
jgi:putative FmdB family regulatory protein